MAETGVEGGVHGIHWNDPEAVLENETGMEAETDGIRSLPADGNESPVAKDRPGDIPPLTRSLRDLSVMVAELKNRLAHLVEVNEALESDLANARGQVASSEGEREDLIKKTAIMQDMESEIEQLHLERDALSVKVCDLGRALSNSEQRVNEIGQLLDRFRAERNEANEEVACLDSQFTRAIKVIEELRNDLAARQEREEELRNRNKLLQEDLGKAVRQRDSYRSELAESLNTLEDVRQSILAASRESQRPCPG